jgi:transketolase
VRQQFIDTATALLDDDPRTAVVLADISTASFAPAAAAHPDRVLNVGIREQLMLSVAGGLALTGLRPFVHSYATFVVDRAYEQIKLDLGHQGVGAVLVSIGASYDGSYYGHTHFSPADVSLLDTLDGWTIHVPGHPDEVAPMLRAAADHDGPVYVRLTERHNRRAGSVTTDRLVAVRDGSRAVIVAVGPMLDPVLTAVEGLDVTVAYTNTPRPFDAAGLRALVDRSTAEAAEATGARVVLVEPYLAGTSTRVVADALADVPHRLLALGVGRTDLHRYGTPADHDRWHGIDPAGLRGAISRFLD